MNPRGTLHLLIGPVGAGKTTYACQCVARSGGVFLDLDSSMVRLYGADTRPTNEVIDWYIEHRERCRGLLWDVSLSILAVGIDVLLEIGLVSAKERYAFYDKARAQDLPLRVHLLDAPRNERRERVARRNQYPQPFTQIVPPALFEAASDAWEHPSEAECEAWELIDVAAVDRL
ncbi:AAA family ATPase [Hyphomicrobium sp. MC8b]|uniref:AAA family ATPase n=1 Tax=Hyphomicrobium sp. MC8b TaxID=300273 RepID=UPI00391A2424